MRPEASGTHALVVGGVGLVSAVGLTARSSVAALRARITRFEEAPFLDWGGVPVIAAQVRGRVEGTIGLERHVALLHAALEDLQRQLPSGLPEGVPMLVGVPLPGRPRGARAGLASLLSTLSSRVDVKLDLESSELVEAGSASLHRAIGKARAWIRSGEHPAVLVAGVDTLVNAPVLDHLQEREALKTAENPDGVIPGEGAGVILLRAAEPLDGAGTLTEIAGLGFGAEEGSAGGESPNTGEGLAEAIRACLADAGSSTAETHFRLSDAAGERWSFAEANYAMARTLAEPHASYPLWLPSESFGALGAASGVAALAVAALAFEKDYAPGPGALCQASAEDGTRAALYCRPLGGADG